MTTTPARYRAQLADFYGPLDLLLYLVRRNELDLQQLPMATITQQFVDYLQVLELLDLEQTGEFVVVASTLLELKSRDALPRPAEELMEETAIATDELRRDLIEQLLEYKRYKEAAQALEQQAAEWMQRYPRLANDQPRRSRNHATDAIKEVELWDLVSALGRVLHRNSAETGSAIVYDETPIHVYVDQIGEQVRQLGQVAFLSLFEGTPSRSKVIGIFLAILELLRHHGFRAEQTQEYGDIVVLPPLAASADEAVPLEPTTDPPA